MNREKPRLAYVVNSLNPGGTERLVVQMSRTFVSDFDLSVVCLDEPGLWGLQLRRQGIPVHCLWRQPGLDFAVAAKLACFCRRGNVDIVHAHQCTPWFYAALSRLIHNRPKLLLEEHGRHFPETENHGRILFNRIFIAPITHRFIAVSEDVKRRLVQYEGLNSSSIEVVYNGVVAEATPGAEERLQMRKDLGLNEDHYLIGAVGRLDPIKNLPLLLKAIASLREKVPNVRALLLGDGPARDSIETLRNELGLTHDVIMPGHRDDARKLIACMDLFVLSSFSEGTSLALLEAMAAGVPAAVTNVGGNPEIVEDGVTGWVVPSDSVTDLAAAILQSASDRQKARRLAETARTRFRENFSYEKMIESYRGIYAELLGSHLSFHCNGANGRICVE